MLASTIILVIVAIAAGYLGAQWQKKRSSSITKREADELIRSVRDLRQAIDEMRLIFNEHWDTHKIIKYDIEILDHNVAVIGQAVGMEQTSLLH
jgi:hypothetical protein